MKLRPIVATMMVMGLSAPAFAASTAASQQAQIDSMKAQISKMEAVINTQSAGGYFQPCDWMNRITISGMINADASYSNTIFNFGANPALRPESSSVTGYTSNLALNNANLFIDAVVNEYTKAHVSLEYTNNLHAAFTRFPEQSSRESANVVNPNGSNKLTIDEAYATIANFAESPIFFRAGKEYVPFGQYQRYPMLENPTQLLSQTNAVAAQLGFVTPVGFYGSAYTFRGIAQNATSAGGAGNLSYNPRVENFGFNLGYAYCDQDVSVKLDAGYIRNMADVDYVSQNIGQYHDKVGGIALSADGRYQQFDAALRYVGALTTFNANDINTVDQFGNVTNGAKPYAWGAEAGFSFPVVNNRNSRVALGYQRTRNASDNVTNFGSKSIGGFGLPLDRIYGSYVVNVSKWVDIGLEIARDRDYNVSDGGSGTNATAGILRLGVKFA